MGLPDDWDGLFDSGDPDKLLADGQRFKEVIEQEAKASVREMHLKGMFDNEIPSTDLTLDDRILLQSLGISSTEQSYEYQSILPSAIERIVDPVNFSIRLRHLYEAIVALEDNGKRPLVSECRTMIADAFFTSEVRYLEPGALSIVEGELDVLAQEHPTSLMNSARCADLLRRADPTIYELYTRANGWPPADLGGC